MDPVLIAALVAATPLAVLILISIYKDQKKNQGKGKGD